MGALPFCEKKTEGVSVAVRGAVEGRSGKRGGETVVKMMMIMVMMTIIII